MSDPFVREYPATLSSLGDARHHLRAWLADEVPDEVAANDLLTVAGEFFLHVVVRTGGDAGRASVVAERGPDGVRLSVTSVRAAGVVRALRLPPDPLAAGAIGRRLVDGCCDDVEVDDGERVGARCRRAVRPAAS